MIVLTAQDIIKKLLGVTIEKLSFIMHNTITGYDKGVALRCRTCRIFLYRRGTDQELAPSCQRKELRRNE